MKQAEERSNSMLVIPAFSFGQIVYLKTDTDQNPRVVSAIKIRPGCQPEYGLACVADETYHFEFEISEDKIY